MQKDQNTALHNPNALPSRKTCLAAKETYARSAKEKKVLASHGQIKS